jgi:hypothetical protein
MKARKNFYSYDFYKLSQFFLTVLHEVRKNLRGVSGQFPVRIADIRRQRPARAIPVGMNLPESFSAESAHSHRFCQSFQA